MTILPQLICFVGCHIEISKNSCFLASTASKVLTHHGRHRIMKQDDSKGDTQGEGFLNYFILRGKRRQWKLDTNYQEEHRNHKSREIQIWTILYWLLQFLICLHPKASNQMLLKSSMISWGWIWGWEAKTNVASSTSQT